MSDPAAYVHVELAGVTRLVGYLFASAGRSTFSYAPEWLQAQDRFALEPALTVAPGPYYTAPGRALFGALGDSAPDRWGRRFCGATSAAGPGPRGALRARCGRSTFCLA